MVNRRASGLLIPKAIGGFLRHKVVDGLGNSTFVTALISYRLERCRRKEARREQGLQTLGQLGARVNVISATRFPENLVISSPAKPTTRCIFSRSSAVIGLLKTKRTGDNDLFIEEGEFVASQYSLSILAGYISRF
jgi:hypothetical protein